MAHLRAAGAVISFRAHCARRVADVDVRDATDAADGRRARRASVARGQKLE
eukprot:IDg22000t1